MRPDQVVNAPEPRAILEHRAVDGTLALTALARSLAHEYVPAPHSIFRAIKKLPAGHWLTYSEGRVKIEPYWDVHFGRAQAIGEVEAVEALRAVLDLSVRQHLVSDVPLGVFLSGGIDSSTVAPYAPGHFGGRLPVSIDDLSLDFRLKRFVEGMDFAPVERHAAWLGSFTPAEQGALLTADALARLPGPPSYAAFHEMLAHAPSASGLERMLYLDLKGYLGEGVLTKVDRASMACSLEVRVPLLDRRVVELAASLPIRLKLRGLTTKYVLKRTLAGMLPREILARPKKGFGVPLARWFRADLAPLLRDLCAPDVIRRAGLFRPDTVERLLTEHAAGRRDHRKKLYTLLAFQLWASRYHPA